MIKIKNLTKKFDKNVIFDNFSYTFSDVGCYALVGDSGIGKTTLLRIISGLDKDYSGEIISDFKGCSVAFQEYRLFPELTAVQNVIFAISDTNSEAVFEISKNMLEKLGFIDDEINLIPRELSGGMKQRVSLARAFLYDAPVLLLDEPTKELDENNARIVREIIAEESKKRLVIMVSHNKDDITALNAIELHLK